MYGDQSQIVSLEEFKTLVILAVSTAQVIAKATSGPITCDPLSPRERTTETHTAITPLGLKSLQTTQTTYSSKLIFFLLGIRIII